MGNMKPKKITLAARRTKVRRGSQLRLFCVMNARTRELVKVEEGSHKGDILYYVSKAVAKTARDYYADITGEDFIVGLGPDHKRYMGDA